MRYKLNAVAENTTKSGKVLYVAGNNDFILGDIGTVENEPYNTTDFYDCMEKSFGKLPETEKLEVKSIHKPKEKYWDAFHYVVNGVDFIGINIDPDTAFNTHEGYYTDETLEWVKGNLLKVLKIYTFKHNAVFKIQFVFFIDIEVIGHNADFTSVGNGKLNFVTVEIDTYDVEGYKIFAIVQFEFRKIILTELC